MLNRLRTDPYEVGADLRDALSFEVWPLVLPDAPVHALCIGVDASTARTTASYSTQVTLIDPAELGRVAVASADVVVIGDEALAAIRDDRGAAALDHLVPTDATIVAGPHVAQALERAGWSAQERIWCAPTWTHAVALAPSQDMAAVDWMRRHGLVDPATTVPGMARSSGTRHDELVLLRRAASPRQPAGVPAWLERLASGSGSALTETRWTIWARRHYSSQKVVAFLFESGADEPTTVVKLPRDPRFNSRVDVDHGAISRVHSLPGHRDHVPAPRFVGDHAGRRVAAVAAVHGRQLASVQDERVAPIAGAVVDWVARLGADTARPVAASDVAAQLAPLVDRFVAIYDPPESERRFLDDQLGVLADVAAPIPLVMQHGNVADWNVVVGEGGHLVLLDWEFAEDEGLPLWDLFFFLRVQAWPLARGWRRVLLGRWRPRRDQFLLPGDTTVAAAVAAYRRRVDVPLEAVEPIFHLCWVDQCLNAATHAAPGELATTPMHRLLRRGIAMSRRGELEPALVGSQVRAGTGS